MHEVRTEMDIAAPVRRVWEVLTHFPAHATWNPFVRSISGVASKGQRLQISVQPPGGKSMSFKPKVLVAVPETELRWLGSLFVPGLFDGEHYFKLAPNGSGGTTLLHGEKFSGLLVPLVRSSLDSSTRAGFLAMNEALKTRCEVV
jgi:hypothetical protein